ncbi:Arginyl-tRNA--protein transferase 1 [Podila epigama]|nr:Arginyl-tRNA--protein transferase 1 [Podila epigama]
MLLSEFSVVTPYDDNVSSCGYCKSSNGSRTYGFSAHLMTCKDYQKLINRGWRRMKANEFEASKHQRQTVNRFNHFVQEGDEKFEKDIAERLQEHQDATMTEAKADTESVDDVSGQQKKQKPRKPAKNVPTDLRSRIQAAEYEHGPEDAVWKHRFKVKLEPSSFSEEKHELYVKYQMSVHNEPKSKCGESNYTHFLVDSPLTATVKPEDWSEENPGYGSFHQCYYLDNKLIAVSVIDILPECVSAVYFYYDPVYSVLSLGKYSAQREIALVQTLNSRPEYKDLQHYYMGFYIFTCPKMSYKGQFHPSFLLDPETYEWIEFKKCKEILGAQRYSTFTNPCSMDPLFEAKIQAIINKKKGTKADGNDSNDTNDDDEDNDDGWTSVDDDDDDNDDVATKGQGQELDPDQFNAKALKGDLLPEESAGQSLDSAAREQAATDGEDVRPDTEKEKKRMMNKVFKDVSQQPPPGCLDATTVMADDLENVYCMSGQSTLVPVTTAPSYKNYKSVRQTVAKYYAMVGHDLAESMLLYMR